MSQVVLPSADVGEGAVDFKPIIMSPMSEEGGLIDEPVEAGATSPRGFSKDSYVTEEEEGVEKAGIKDKVNVEDEMDMGESPHNIFCRAKSYERKEDYKTAMELFGQAADQGHLSSMVSYALLLVSTDETMAFEWLTTAADHGNGRAFYHLGQLFARGSLFPISPRAAAKCWKRSAVLGDSCGRSAYALCYIRGFGVKQDVDKGVQMIKQVAEVDKDLTAMKNIAYIYRHAKGVEKDMEQADLWRRRAVERETELKEADKKWASWNIKCV